LVTGAGVELFEGVTEPPQLTSTLETASAIPATTTRPIHIVTSPRPESLFTPRNNAGHGSVVPTTELLELEPASESVVSVVSLVAPPDVVLLEPPVRVTGVTESSGVELLSLPQLTMMVEATRARPAIA